MNSDQRETCVIWIKPFMPDPDPTLTPGIVDFEEPVPEFAQRSTFLDAEELINLAKEMLLAAGRNPKFEADAAVKITIELKPSSWK